MNNSWKRVVILLSFIALGATGFAEVVKGALAFSSEGISWSTENGYDRVIYEGESDYYSANPGEPQLPKGFFRLALPEKAVIQNITITKMSKQAVKRDFNAYPGQPVYSMSEETPDFVGPDGTIYQTNQEYPYGDTIYFVGDSWIRGKRVANFGVNIFTCNPVTKTLYFISDLEYSIEYELVSPPPGDTSGETMYPANNEVFSALMLSSVENPESVQTYSMAAPENQVDFLIITSKDLRWAFEDYAYTREKATSMSFKVVPVEDIYAAYNEATNQLEIKRCIQDYITNNNTSYVLLGGDDTIVPPQYCVVDENRFPDLVPTDLFYACFDGTFNWNQDGDQYIGEKTGDNVDLVPDVFLGRLPVRTANDVSGYKYKMERYLENSTSGTSYMENILSGGVRISRDGDIERSLNEQYEKVIQPNWLNSKHDTLYDSQPGVYVTKELLQNTLSSKNYNAVNIFTHGDHDAWRMEPGGIENNYTPQHALALRSEPMGVVTTNACSTAAYDNPQDPCLAEAFIRNRDGGPIVYIGGTREGYNGDSDSHIRTFYQELLFNKRANYLNVMGVAFALGKYSTSLKDAIDSSGTTRWIHYSNSYFGDPSAVFFEKQEDYWWEEIKNNTALDVGAGADGTVCIVGADYKVYKRGDDFRWTLLGGLPGYAMKVDTDPAGNPWVINDDRMIYWYNGSSWEYKGNQAMDITVGGDGSVYIVSDTYSTSEGYTIRKWLNPGWIEIAGRKGNRISANNEGDIYTVNKMGVISYYDGTSWNDMPGRASDIGVAANGTVFITGYKSTYYGYYIYRWLDGGGWQKIFGEATAVDVEPDGTPWHLNKNGTLYIGRRDENMVYNPDMNWGTSGWHLYTMDGGDAYMTTVNKEMKISVTNGGSYAWSVIFAQTGMNIEKGETYTFSYWAKHENPALIVPSEGTISLNAPPWTEYSINRVYFTDEYRRYSKTFTMTEDTDPQALFQICLGITERDIYIDTMSLVKHSPESENRYPAWTISKEYFTGDIVFYNGKYWVSQADFGIRGTAPGETYYWRTVKPWEM